jgi:hypothetical protein
VSRYDAIVLAQGQIPDKGSAISELTALVNGRAARRHAPSMPRSQQHNGGNDSRPTRSLATLLHSGELGQLAEPASATTIAAQHLPQHVVNAVGEHQQLRRDRPGGGQRAECIVIVSAQVV